MGGAQTAASYGQDGWLAMLLLFGTVGMVGFFSIPLAIVLGVGMLFVGMLIGLISWSTTGGAAVAILIVGIFISYRLRV